MDLMQIIKDWVWIASAAAPFLFGWAMLYLKERFPTKDEHARQAAELKASVDGLSGKVQQHYHDAETRIGKLEARAEHLPTRRDLEDISNRLAKVETATAVTNEALLGLQKMLGKVDHTATLLLTRELNEAPR